VHVVNVVLGARRTQLAAGGAVTPRGAGAALQPAGARGDDKHGGRRRDDDARHDGQHVVERRTTSGELHRTDRERQPTDTNLRQPCTTPH